MREDLVQYVPALEDADTLLCPICCRPLRYEQFSLEYILPQQAVKLDPADVRNAIIKNERSGLTLLCSETLIVGNKSYAKGCNGWKGRNFDTRISDLLKRGPFSIQFTDMHIIALLVLGYLGLFKQYGYRVALTESSLVVRNQFFNPRRFNNRILLNESFCDSNSFPDNRNDQESQCDKDSRDTCNHWICALFSIVKHLDWQRFHSRSG